MIVILERGDIRPIQGVLLDQRTYYQRVLRWMSRTKKLSIDRLPTHSPYVCPLRRPWPDT